MDGAAAEPRSVADFLVAVASAPWFRNIGQPTPAAAGVDRVSRWEDWPGPREPSVAELGERQQALYDDLMRAAGGRRDELSALWGRIQALVFEVAAPAVPYDPRQDTWHAPTAAVWQAAWTAGLVGLCLQSGRPVPPELQAQWEWFARGHWPCGYATQGTDVHVGQLLVY